MAKGQRKKFKEWLLKELGSECRLCGRREATKYMYLKEDVGYFDIEVPPYWKWTEDMARQFLPGFSIVCKNCLKEWKEFSKLESAVSELLEEANAEGIKI